MPYGRGRGAGRQHQTKEERRQARCYRIARGIAWNEYHNREWHWEDYDLDDRDRAEVEEKLIEVSKG